VLWINTELTVGCSRRRLRTLKGRVNAGLNEEPFEAIAIRDAVLKEMDDLCGEFSAGLISRNMLGPANLIEDALAYLDVFILHRYLA
jgi:hypothetical protein